VGEAMVGEEPVDVFRPGCKAAGRSGAGTNACSAPQRLETTLLEVVSDISDTLQNDAQTIRLVARLIRERRIRTPEGLEIRLSSQ
jgi:hypothetical protein